MSTTQTVTAEPVHPFDTTPAASRHATYPSDARHMVGEVYGPNTLGEVLTAVIATFDQETGATRVGFAYGEHDLRRSVYAAPVGTEPTDVGAFNPIGRLVEVTQ